MAGASLGGMGFMHEQGGLPIPDIVHVPQPYWYAEGGDLSPAEFGLKTARALEEKILELGPQRIAAFIGEPIQGAGGVIIPPDSYWPEVQAICDRHGILLVADEVICGFGRTGYWFGSERFGIKPDLMTIAKGLSSGYLPIGGVMVGDRIAEVIIDKGGEFAPWLHVLGHPASCAVASVNLTLLQQENLIPRTRDETGPYLAAKWRQLAEHPLVGEARSAGLIGALELVRNKETRQFFDNRGEVGTICRDFCFQNGLIMRAVRDTMIVSPPLVIMDEQIDELAEKAWTCLDLTLARCRAEGRL
jgi:putrescine aminotransferase